MKIDRKGLKAQAKQAIRAAAPVFWLVTLVYLLLTEGLSTVVGWLAPTFQPADLLWGGTVGWLSLFISILLTLYLWVMDLAIACGPSASPAASRRGMGRCWRVSASQGGSLP